MDPSQQRKINDLVGMGFPESHAKVAVERLKNATTEQLVDYVISNGDIIERFLAGGGLNAQQPQPQSQPQQPPPPTIMQGLPPAPSVPRSQVMIMI